MSNIAQASTIVNKNAILSDFSILSENKMKKLLSSLLFVSSLSFAQSVSIEADQTAKYAVDSYQKDTIAALAKMVSFKTVAVEGLAYEKNPEFSNFKAYIKSLSETLGLRYKDHGYVMTVSLGEGSERIGIVTHGDVQPADASKWKKSPYELDSESKPGFLIARGTEDDKGPIATAMYAMKAIKDKNIKMKRSIELIIYMAEESNWEPFRAFLKEYKAPSLNVTIDAEYPVVTAEKGWSMIRADMPKLDVSYKQPWISEFFGGSFGSQIPEDATAVIQNVDKALLGEIKNKALQHPRIQFSFKTDGQTLTIKAKGKSAHSSTPEDGINAVSFLADVLSGRKWPKSTAGLTVAYLNDLVGTGMYAEKFGNIAYEDDFMGPMTLAPTVVKKSDKGININLNLRRPAGKSADSLQSQTNVALRDWQKQYDVKLENIQLYFGEPMVVSNAPHVEPLLRTFSHFTGQKNPQPISIGGSTNAKLLPNAVSFGPSMPGVEYTGHSENEFISVKQLKLNLAMYTAMMIELSNL